MSGVREPYQGDQELFDDGQEWKGARGGEGKNGKVPYNRVFLP